MSKKLVFVYGSLLSGLGNHSIIASQEYVGEATTEPEYTMISMSAFPGLLEAEEGQGVKVKGELYLVNESGMERLDMLEGVCEETPEDGMYRREDIKLDDGSVAIGYIYNDSPSWRSHHTYVESGDWREYYEGKSKSIIG